jgi:hypothetical protein
MRLTISRAALVSWAGPDIKPGTGPDHGHSRKALQDYSGKHLSPQPIGRRAGMALNAAEVSYDERGATIKNHDSLTAL